MIVQVICLAAMVKFVLITLLDNINFKNTEGEIYSINIELFNIQKDIICQFVIILFFGDP